MTEKEQEKNAKEFVEYWKDKGYEKGQSQQFWTSLLTRVFNIKEPEKFIEFEDQVHIDRNTGFIDAYIPSTKVLIEQKSIDKDLRKGIRQSDDSLLTPFQQAKKYIAELPVSKHPKYVVTCNFKSFLIYNMENPNAEPEEILLENLAKEYYRLQFIVETGNEHLKREMEISIQAGELVGKLYDEMIKLYIDPKNEETLKSLNMFCVRLVFCLYAEDSGLFGKKMMFHDYLNRFETRDLRRALIDLFKVLDTKIENRDPYLNEELAQFPYVNGGLFANENIEIPQLNDKIKDLLLTKASEDFDWSEISPTIFGAVFESTLNLETRRSGGMHYTSIENIHKVIDPLFFDELNAEFEKIDSISVIKTKREKLEEFQNKLSKLTFLDPACGSGNFLTETYLSLRKLENKVIERLNTSKYEGQILFGDERHNPIKVSISQFYGIEINDFAVTVATTALWIAESQMMKETENILHINLDFLPLKSYTNITEGNALRINWNDIIPKEKLNYIMGNPPFVGARLMNKKQKDDLMDLFVNESKIGNLDYVSSWYIKASKYIQNTNIQCAFVSTNSICQGEQVSILWKPLTEKYKIFINFAYRTFRWDSEASSKAHVHCIIVGFSTINQKEKYLFDNTKIKKCDNINAYLMDAPDIFIESHSRPICSNVKTINAGSLPNDGGYLLLTEEEKNCLIAKYPIISKYIKQYMMGRELLNNIKKYCLWFFEEDITAVQNIPEIRERLYAIKQKRLESPKEKTREQAAIPYLFAEIRQPKSTYLAIPKTSSVTRKYIPVGFLDKDIIIGSEMRIIPNATIYDFGIIESNVHMAWTKTFCGRMKSDFIYSASIVYNNFPWCNPTNQQKEKIEKTAQAILDARALYPNNSLAELYDELTMPKELRKAHQENDKAVMEAYGFDWRKMTESDCVAELMKMYEKLINNET